MRKKYLFQLTRRVLFGIIPIIGAFLAVCCQKTDLSGIEGEINSLDGRLSVLEKSIEVINNSISALNDAIAKLEKKVYVSNVISKDNSYILKFTDGTMLEIHSGKSGVDAPVAGVKKDENGRYCWTFTINGKTNWLLDGDGKKMPVSGLDGLPGLDGRDGQDNTSDGTAERILPEVGIDKEGYWIVSYDKGKSFVRIIDENGFAVKAIADSSSAGDSIFKGIEEYDDSVVITLLNGTSLSLEKFREAGLIFSVADSLKIKNNSGQFSFEITGNAEDVRVEAVEKGQLLTSVTMKTPVSGTVNVEATDKWTEGCSVVVLLCTGRHTVTYVIPVAEYEFADNTNDPAKEIDIPEELLKYMPVYKGSNPPALNGSFLMSPNECVYCSDGYYQKGNVCVSEIYNFSNMSTLSRTIDVRDESIDGYSYEEGLGYYICGSGDNFTIYANVEGETGGVQTKMSYLYSGTVTPNGIKNFHVAFIMQWKSEPGCLMDVGSFRVFKDDLAEPTQWIEFTKSTVCTVNQAAEAKGLKNYKSR